MISFRIVTLTLTENDNVPQAPNSSDWYTGGARFKSQPRHQVTWYTFRIMTLSQMKPVGSCSGQRSTNGQRSFCRCGQSSSPMDASPHPHTNERCWWIHHITADLIFSSYQTCKFLLLSMRGQIHGRCRSVLGRSNNFQCLQQSMSWIVLFWCDNEKVLRRILGLFSIVVLKASEVSTAALAIHEDAMIPNAHTAMRLRFASELNINCVVVRAPTPKRPIYS